MSSTAIPVAPPSRALMWTGRVISFLPAAALLASAGLKLARLPSVEKGFADLGYPQHLILGLGILEMACAIVYLIPRTAVLGAILMTGYLGGAITTHLRVGQPPILQAVLGVLVWLGLYFREPRLRLILPLRSTPPRQDAEMSIG